MEDNSEYWVHIWKIIAGTRVGSIDGPVYPMVDTLITRIELVDRLEVENQIW